MNNKKIALVGQPNSGKSTLFNVLSDVKTMGGITVNILASEINANGNTFTLIDLPGPYSLNPVEPAEKVTLDYLISQDVDLIINVVDASRLERSLELTIELIEFGLPVVIALNMYDEAEKHGLKIDIDKLSKLLNIPVVPTVALHGKGVKTLVNRCSSLMARNEYKPAELNYTHHLEVGIRQLTEKISPLLNDINGTARFYAIKSIENPEILPVNVLSSIEGLRNRIESENIEQHHIDSFESISYERHHLAMKIAEECSVYVQRKERAFREKLDDLLLHPYLGYMFMLIFSVLYFFSIFIVGDFLNNLLEYPLLKISESFAPLNESEPFLWHTINGAYMGFSGVVGIVLPFFLPLVFLTSIFEDTGYTARIAFLVDGLMHKIGLHGKSVVPFVLGFGCTVPAIYASRIIESERDRTVTAILLPFIPCSARIAVIFSLTAAFAGALWVLIVFFYVIIVIAVVGKILSKIISQPMGLILEIPALRTPSIKNTISKTWLRTRYFIKDAFIFLVGGSMVLGWIEYFHVDKYIDIVLAPLVKTAMGLPEQLGSTLVFGFFRKELIIVMANQALNVPTLSQLTMTPQQVLVFIIFVTFYFPCFTTFIVLWKEFGAKTVLLSSVISLIVATFSAVAFRIVLSL